MVDAVDLDPAGYDGTYKLIGGTPALDFANLVSYRGTARAHDWLDPPANLDRWVHAARLDVSTPADRGPLIELREALASVLLDVADDRRPRGADFATIAAAAAGARSRQRLVWDTEASGAAWTPTRSALADLLADDAAGLLTDDARRRRIGACDECRWVYLDTTRNRSRRWCDPADCGNRARQRRHYHRTR